MDTAQKIREMVAAEPNISTEEVARRLGVKSPAISTIARRNGIQFSHPLCSDVTKIGDVCPACGNQRNPVKDSRPAQFRGIPAVRRRRKCSECGEIWATFELSEPDITKALNPERLKREIARKLIAAALGDAS